MASKGNLIYSSQRTSIQRVRVRINTNATYIFTSVGVNSYLITYLFIANILLL